MSPREATAVRLLDFLGKRHDEMTQLLTALVAIESPSHDPRSQVAVQQLLQDALSDRGFRVRRVAGRQTGGHLLAVPQGRSGSQPIQLLLGHCDTVWPIGTLADMPVRQSDGKLHGPGVYDMKCGLVQAIFALEAIRQTAERPSVTPVMFINSDEEIGSPESSGHIERLAKIADRAFVMEPSLGPSGKLKTARKGVGRFTVRVRGRASHAGLAPEEGASAILELSHVVQSLFALNNAANGTTVNVGTVDGGLRPNVVAPEASAVADVRVATQTDARRVEEAIYGLVPTVPGTRLEISGHVGRPPMERTPGNRRLWELAQEAATELSIELDQGMAGGGSDGNSTSLYTPTIDGMGAVGDGAHASTEFVYVEKMPERAALLARMLLFPPVARSFTETPGPL